MVMVAWPEGVHHVLALPQDRQAQQKTLTDKADETIPTSQNVHNPEEKLSNEREQDQHEVHGFHLVAKDRDEIFRSAGFWDCFTNSAYTDLILILQDGQISVNR